LVKKDGKTIYENSFGYADGSKTIQLTRDHRFDIGSIYKEFPATAIMQLHEKKLLHIDDKISTYLPELPTWAKTISIKHLMQYSSGLPLIPWNAYFEKGEPVNNELLFSGIMSLKNLEFEPGTDYLYSNNNPFLLMKIVEKVSDSTYEEYLKQHFFKPLGMNGTILKSEYPYHDRTLMAIPFDEDYKEDDYKFSVKGLLFSSTSSDLVSWFEFLGAYNIVNKASVKILSDTFKSGANIQSPLGECVWSDGKLIEHTHHGSTANFEAIVKHYQQEKLTIVILTNQKHRNVNEIADNLYKMVQNQD